MSIEKIITLLFKTSIFHHILIMWLIAYCLLLLPAKTFAHVLETDGPIGAVIHIEPEDDPIVGQQASFFFEFKDKTGKFNGTNCDCQAIISKDGKELFKGSIYTNTDKPSLDNSSLFFIFPEKGIYTLTITGTPLEEGAFQSFILKEEIRVERTNSQSSTNQTSDFFGWHIIHFVVFAGGMIIILILLLVKKK